MQVGIMTVITSTPAGSTLGGTDANAGGNAGSDLFSQLLGDAGASLGGETGQGTPNGGLLAGEVGASALLAQEVGTSQPSNPSVTPQQASDLLAKLDAHLGAQSDTASQQDSGLFQSLRNALQQVADGNQPQTVASIVQNMQAQENTAAGNGSAMQRMIAWMQAALKQPQEAPAQADAAQESMPGASATDVAASLQAASFRTHDGVDETADAGEPQTAKSKKDETVTTVTPLSNTTVIPVWVQQFTDTHAANPELDSAIPPLALNDAQKLPQVSLPGQQDDAAVDTGAAGEQAAAQAASTTPAASSAPSWLDHLPFPLTLANEQAMQPSAPTPEPQPPVADAEGAAPVQAVAQENLPQASATVIAVDKAQTNPQAIASDAPLSLGTVGEAKASAKQDARTRADALADAAKTDIAGNATNNATAIAPTQNSQGATTNTSNAQNTQQLNAGAHATPAEQVHVAIRAATADGIKHITIQLEPNDLGHVEVSMTTGPDGRTHMSFTADKASTLSMLSRDAASLERSLADTGVKADAGSMQFNLRQQPQQQPQMSGNFNQGSGQGQGASSYQRSADESDALAPLPVNGAALPATQHYTINVKSGVDIHA